MRKPIILTGKKFGRLTVVGQAPSRKTSAQIFWHCVCDCGTERVIVSQALRTGVTKSCGCWKNELIGNSNRTHGLRGHFIYLTWHRMLRRCYEVKNKDFKDYGGRGIKVCEFLRVSPANLLSTVGERPHPKHSLDRPDNNGNYSCGKCAQCLSLGWVINVRWANATQQVRNRRTAVTITKDGVTKSPLEWAEELGIKCATFRMRIHRGTDPFRQLQK